VTVPRLPVVVSVPEFEIVATVGSELDHRVGTFVTVLLLASNAVMAKLTVAGVMTSEVLGDTVMRVTVAPGPAYCTVIVSGDASPLAGCDFTGPSPWKTRAPPFR